MAITTDIASAPPARKTLASSTQIPKLMMFAIAVAIQCRNYAKEMPEVSPGTSVKKTASRPRYDLRFNWSSMPVQTPFGKNIARHQLECPSDGENRTQFWVHEHETNGLGQNLHVWSQSLCLAMQDNVNLLTRGKWAWMHGDCHAEAKRAGYNYSPMSCYFGHESAPNCPSELLPKSNEDPIRVRGYTKQFYSGFGEACQGFWDENNLSVGAFRAASMEWLFSSVNDNVIAEARRQALEAFNGTGLPDPENLVTVHIRWGDKKTEMPLLPVSAYINQVYKIVGNRARNETMHIYLATETPAAIDAFYKEAPKNWIVHMSGPVTPTNDTHMPAFAGGDTGLESLGALLLSMESNYYVLTLKSNWSRVINELRKNIVNPRCNACTRMADLSPPGFRQFRHRA